MVDVVVDVEKDNNNKKKTRKKKRKLAAAAAALTSDEAVVVRTTASSTTTAAPVTVSTNMAPTATIPGGGSNWNSSSSYYTYPVDYNDHFETPLIAYQDILPLLQNVNVGSMGRRRRNSDDTAYDNDHDTNTNNDNDNAHNHRPTPIILYDPYYCNGRTKVLLEGTELFQWDHGGDEVDDDDAAAAASKKSTSCTAPSSSSSNNNSIFHVLHEKRDFYADIRNQTLPNHGIYDALITNPPYSDANKIKCIQYCIGRFNNSMTNSNTNHPPTPFFLLMPKYVVTKSYWKEHTQTPTTKKKNNFESTTDGVFDVNQDVVYIVPSQSYVYEHPAGTGATTSPFESLWYCGIGRQRIAPMRTHFATWCEKKKSRGSHRRPQFVTSVHELETRGIISTERRLNPRQRRKQKRQKFQNAEHETTTTRTKATTNASVSSRSTTTTTTTTTTTLPDRRTTTTNRGTFAAVAASTAGRVSSSVSSSVPSNTTKPNTQTTTKSSSTTSTTSTSSSKCDTKKTKKKKRNRRQSRYRDQTGTRTKTRFWKAKE